VLDFDVESYKLIDSYELVLLLVTGIEKGVPSISHISSEFIIRYHLCHLETVAHGLLFHCRRR